MCAHRCIRDGVVERTVARDRFAEWKPDNCLFQCDFDPSGRRRLPAPGNYPPRNDRRIKSQTSLTLPPPTSPVNHRRDPPTFHSSPAVRINSAKSRRIGRGAIGFSAKWQRERMLANPLRRLAGYTRRNLPFDRSNVGVDQSVIIIRDIIPFLVRTDPEFDLRLFPRKMNLLD